MIHRRIGENDKTLKQKRKKSNDILKGCSRKTDGLIDRENTKKEAAPMMIDLRGHFGEELVRSSQTEK
jgi:hypothetical protein